MKNDSLCLRLSSFNSIGNVRLGKYQRHHENAVAVNRRHGDATAERQKHPDGIDLVKVRGGNLGMVHQDNIERRKAGR